MSMLTTSTAANLVSLSAFKFVEVTVPGNEVFPDASRRVAVLFGAVENLSR